MLSYLAFSCPSSPSKTNSLDFAWRISWWFAEFWITVPNTGYSAKIHLLCNVDLHSALQHAYRRQCGFPTLQNLLFCDRHRSDRFAESAQRFPSVMATANKLVTFSAFHPQNYIYIFCYVEAQRRQSVHRCCFDLRAGATWVFRVVTHADSTLWQVPWNNSSGPVQRFVINLSILNAYSKWSVEWAEQNTDVLKKFINWPPRCACQGKWGCMVVVCYC